MIKVYLDSNIYSYFKYNGDALDGELVKPTQKLKSILLERQDKYLCFYSEAHIFDLKKDKTDNWKHNLKEIEAIANDNFLSKNHQSHNTSYQLVTPQVIFSEYLNPENLGDLLNFDQLKDLPEAQKRMLDEVLDIQLPFDLPELSGNRDLDDLLLLLFGDRKETYTFRDIFNQAPIFLNKLFSDPKSFQGIRRMMLDLLQLKKKWGVSIDKKDFMEKLKFTPIGKEFFDFVGDSLSKKKGDPGYDYDFFTSAYSMLNALGIDFEKNKEVKFPNMFFDGLHSFFGAHCHIVISEDQGFLTKSKVLYEKLGIDTQVLSTIEFLDQYENQKDYRFDDITDFFLQIFNSKGELVGDYPHENGQKTIEYEFSPWLFNYFNRIEFSIHDEIGNFLALSQKTNLWTRITSWKEYANIISHLINVLGIDDQGKGEFSEIEKEEINSGNWKGRLWNFEKIRAGIEINPRNELLTFVVLYDF
jgi:hypothetical protein